MKRLLKLVLFLVFAAALLLVGISAFADRAVKRGIEEGATYALGVETLLDGVELDFREGRIGLTGLLVANPEGFPDPHVLELDEAELQVPLTSLFSDVVDVPLFALRGGTVTLDRNAGRTNFEVLLQNLERFQSDEEGAETPSPSTKRFRIQELRLERLGVHIDLGLSGAIEQGGVLDIDLGPIVLTDLDSSGEGLSIPEISRRVLTAILESSIKAGGADLPAELRKRLESSLANARKSIEGSVQDLERRAAELEGKVEEVLKGVDPELGEEVDAAQEKLEKGLGGLLGGDKGDDTDKDKDGDG